jgi:predicted nucleic acid-binding protein
MKPILEAGPLITACKFDVGGTIVIDYLTPVVSITTTTAVRQEVVVAGSHYPDAAVAKARIDAGEITVRSPVSDPDLSSVLAMYGLGLGESEAILLASQEIARDPTTVLVVDDVLAYVVCDRLKVNKLLFLDFLVALVDETLLKVADAKAIVQAVQTRYPKSFVGHTLHMLARR